MRKRKLLTVLKTLLRVAPPVRITRLPTQKEIHAREDYRAHKEMARECITKKLIELNQHYGFTYHRVFIRDQRSRWGSCSKKGNLNFNYRLLYLPLPLLELVVVHELCHLKEFNHGVNFWKLVAETIPDYAKRRAALGRFSLRSRLPFPVSLS